MTTFEITESKLVGGRTVFELYSIVSTDFGGTAKNYVCCGSREYCQQIKSELISDMTIKEAQGD